MFPKQGLSWRNIRSNEHYEITCPNRITIYNKDMRGVGILYPFYGITATKSGPKNVITKYSSIWQI